MKGKNFQENYRRMFAKLGCQLTTAESIPLLELAGVETKLGVRLPKALRDYYLIAGRENKFNRAHNRLLDPTKLDVHSGKLIFMEENQWAVVWSVDASSEPQDDPPVYQGPIVRGEPSGWFLEERCCSVFLVFMLHLQAAFGGGMPYRASAPAPENLRDALDRDWDFIGEINKMRNYSRNGQAVCFLKWREMFDKGESWRVFAGASTKSGLDAISKDLDLKWD